MIRVSAVPAPVLELAFACAAGDAIGLVRGALRGLVAVLFGAVLAAGDCWRSTTRASMRLPITSAFLSREMP